MATKSWLVAVVIGAMAIGCGGHKSQTTEPTGGGGDDDSGGGVSSNPCGDNGMCPPEMLDKIKETLDSKRLIVCRAACPMR
jgi:hypothetical protein